MSKITIEREEIKQITIYRLDVNEFELTYHNNVFICDAELVRHIQNDNVHVLKVRYDKDAGYVLDSYTTVKGINLLNKLVYGELPKTLDFEFCLN